VYLHDQEIPAETLGSKTCLNPGFCVLFGIMRATAAFRFRAYAVYRAVVLI